MITEPGPNIFNLKIQSKSAPGGDFPGGPVVKTPRFHCRGAGLIPGQGTGIPHAMWAWLGWGVWVGW